MWQAARWLVVCSVALASTAAAAEAEWSGQEISDKFNQVDKKLRDIRELEAKDKTTTRRIVEIEAAVRDLRGSVKALELRLKTIEAILKTLGGDIAAVRKIADGAVATAAEAGKPKLTTTSTTPQPTGPAAEILDEQARADGGFRTITGTIQNRTTRALTFVVVQATFLDANGHAIKTESAYTAPRVIPPNGTATFRIYTRDDNRISRHRLSLQAK